MSNFVLKPSCQVSWDFQDPFVKELEAKTTHGQLTLFMFFTMFIKLVLTCPIYPNISSFQTSTMVLLEATRVATLVWAASPSLVLLVPVVPGWLEC